MIFLIPAENVCFHNFPAAVTRSGGVVTGGVIRKHSPVICGESLLPAGAFALELLSLNFISSWLFCNFSEMNGPSFSSRQAFIQNLKKLISWKWQWTMFEIYKSKFALVSSIYLSFIKGAPNLNFCRKADFAVFERQYHIGVSSFFQIKALFLKIYLCTSQIDKLKSYF